MTEEQKDFLLKRNYNCNSNNSYFKFFGDTNSIIINSNGEYEQSSDSKILDKEIKELEKMNFKRIKHNKNLAI